MTNHHLNADTFLRDGGFDPNINALDERPQANAGVPFHITVQIVDVPVRRHASDLAKGDKLQPLYTDMFLQAGPPVEGVPFWRKAVFKTVVNCRPVTKALSRIAAKLPQTAQSCPGVGCGGRLSISPVYVTSQVGLWAVQKLKARTRWRKLSLAPKLTYLSNSACSTVQELSLSSAPKSREAFNRML